MRRFSILVIVLINVIAVTECCNKAFINKATVIEYSNSITKKIDFLESIKQKHPVLKFGFHEFNPNNPKEIVFKLM